MSPLANKVDHPTFSPHFTLASNGFDFAVTKLGPNNVASGLESLLGMDPSPIRSSRLDLVLFTREFEQALFAGDRAAAQELAGFVLPKEFCADEEALAFAKWKRAQVDEDPKFAPWSLRVIVLRSSCVAVGTANFHGPPGINDTGTCGAAEVGYEILVAYRDLGFATEVACAMITWAEQEHGVSHFISGIAPTNLPSLRLNEKLGFVPTGEFVDGELIFELRGPMRSPASASSGVCQMLAIRKLSMILLASSVAVPSLYIGALAFHVYWDFYRRGLPFEGKGAMAGLLMALGLGGSLCVVALLHYIVVSFRERVTLSPGHVYPVLSLCNHSRWIRLRLSEHSRNRPPEMLRFSRQLFGHQWLLLLERFVARKSASTLNHHVCKIFDACLLRPVNPTSGHEAMRGQRGRIRVYRRIQAECRPLRQTSDRRV